MGSGRLAAVADTGPLIHLAEVGCLPLLAIFEQLHIPEGVWHEATRPSMIREVLTFSKRHALTSTEITKFTLDHGLERLQAGERESLLLCRKLAVPVLLTDDLAVRRAAKALDLTPVGSLGIITRAHEMGRAWLKRAAADDEAALFPPRGATLESLVVLLGCLGDTCLREQGEEREVVELRQHSRIRPRVAEGSGSIRDRLRARFYG